MFANLLSYRGDTIAMTAGKKLFVGGLVVAAVTGYLAYLGATSSWQYYLTADECATNAASLVGSRVRVSGRVAPGTLVISDDRTEASFVLAGTEAKLDVRCPGPLPDNLAEQIDVVVEGRLAGGGRVEGQKVLTRCASKYESNDGDASAERVARTAGSATR